MTLKVILSLGSNLSSEFGNRFGNLDHAISLLEKLKISVEKKSSYYETPSYPNEKDPKFINLIISVKTDLKPVNLMNALIDIEKKIGRVRSKKNEPRTCDIDIIDYDNQVLEINFGMHSLRIPHNSLSSRIKGQSGSDGGGDHRISDPSPFRSE